MMWMTKCMDSETDEEEREFDKESTSEATALWKKSQITHTHEWSPFVASPSFHAPSAKLTPPSILAYVQSSKMQAHKDC